MNGHIATQDDRRSFVSAVAIKEGRFLAVGADKEVMAYKGDTTQVINVGGRTVIPGLNDSHLHLIRGGLNYDLELRRSSRLLAVRLSTGLVSIRA
jgi:predicted amidohydrolase YtcJ